MAPDAHSAAVYIQVYDIMGGLVVDGLVHDRVVWDFVGMQPGAPGGTTPGEFTIDLPPLSSEAYKRAYDEQYSKIAYGMRVEAYLGDRAVGDPYGTGIIHKMVESLQADTVQILGFDWAWLLHAQLGLIGEFTPGNNATGGDILKAYCGVNKYMLLDDFAGHGIQNGSYNISPGGSWTTATDEGLSGYTTSAVSGSNLLMNNHNFTDLYSPVVTLEAYFHFSPSVYTNTVIIGEFGILAGFDGVGASALNGWLLRAIAVGDGGSTYHVNAEIVQFSGGVAATQKATTVFTGCTGDRHFQVTAIGDARISGTYIWRVMVNGQDTGCFLSFAISPPSGYVGFRWAGNASSGQTWVSQFVFKQRMVDNKWFAYGAIDTSLGEIPPEVLPVNGQSFLDLVTLGANIAGGAWRLVRKAAFGGDQINLDVLPSIGTSTNIGRDRSDLRVVEGDLLVDLVREANLDALAGGLRTSGSPSSASGGNINWVDIPNALAIGMQPGSTGCSVAVETTMQDADLTDFLTMRIQAQRQVALRSLPGSSKSAVVWRTKETEDLHEYDLITLHCPTMRILEQPVIILAVHFETGSPYLGLTFDQLPWREQDQLEQTRAHNQMIIQQVYGKR